MKRLTKIILAELAADAIIVGGVIIANKLGLLEKPKKYLKAKLDEFVTLSEEEAEKYQEGFGFTPMDIPESDKEEG